MRLFVYSLLTFLLLILHCPLLQAQSIQPTAEVISTKHKGKNPKMEKVHEPFCLVTLAKSGSHLIIKAINEITGMENIWVSSGDPTESRLNSQTRYPWTHFCISPLLKSHLENRKIIVMVRDLRDLSISATHALHTDITKWGKSPKTCRPDFTRLTFADQLRCVIMEECQMEAEDKALIWNFSNSFSQAVDLAQDPRVLICRYEDLVGPEGGGSAEAQHNEIVKIAAYLGISLKEEEVRRIASVIYGDSWTYRKGQIHEWKRIFNEDHKTLFKMKFSPHLIALGYEKDDEW